MSKRIPKIKTIPKAFWRNRDWFRKQFNWPLHTFFPQNTAAVYLIQRHFPFSYKLGLAKLGKDGAWFWDENDLRRVREEILRRAKVSRAYTGWIARNFFMAFHRFIKVTKQCENVNPHTLSDRALYDWYERLFWSEAEVGSWGYIADCFLTSGSEDWLGSSIVEELEKTVSREKLLRIVEALTAPVFHSFVNRERLDLLRIAGNLKRPRGSRAFERHREEYHWIENTYVQAKDLPVEYFVAKLKALQKGHIKIARVLREESSKPRQCARTRQRFIRKYHLSKTLQNSIYIADVFAQIKDMRKEGVLRLNHFLFAFISELMRRRGLSRTEALYTTEQELYDILIKKKINRRELQARAKKCFLFISKKGYKILSGKDAQQVDMSIFEGDRRAVKELKGVAASPGHIIGRVRILRSNVDIPKFKSGEILVANETTPEYVPAMKKAKAILTEQGGVTAHAAIVSRELGIPCIIGIKNVTTLLKNGASVEIDAAKGIVKRR